MRKFTFALMIPVFFLTTGCSSMKNINPMDLLTGNNWVLNSLMGNTLDVSKFAQGLPSLNFLKDGMLTGFTGCNTINGKFDIVGTALNLGNMASTKKNCPGVDEKGFMDALNKVTNFKVGKDKLTLTDGISEIMSFIPKK